MALIAGSFTGCGGNSDSSTAGGDDKVYKLRLAGMSSLESPETIAMQAAADAVKEATGGKVEIQVYPASQLGDYTQVYEEVMRGTIDMACTTIPGTYDAKVEMCYVPYLVTNYEEYAKVYTKGSFFYDKYNELQNNQGIELLGFVPAGFIGIGAAKLNTEGLFEPAKKAELIRVPSLETMKMLVEYTGFNTTTIAYADLYSALQTGVADGWFGGGALLNYNSFRDVIKYFVDYRFLNDVYPVIINQKTLQGIPEEYQQIIFESFEKACLDSASSIEAADAQAMKDMAAYGITVIEPTDEERAALAEAVRTNLWPELTQFYGEDIMNGLLEDVSK
jgi:TRAP-type C4-dicarboxylate transport system substrate-binding protein